VNQFPGGIYKSFKSQGEAEAWLQAPISGQEPRRHTLGPVQVTGSSLGWSPLYRESSPRRHSMSPQAFSAFGAMGLPTTPGTPQAYPSPADSRAHSGSAPAEPQFRATPGLLWRVTHCGCCCLQQWVPVGPAQRKGHQQRYNTVGKTQRVQRTHRGAGIGTFWNSTELQKATLGGGRRGRLEGPQWRPHAVHH